MRTSAPLIHVSEAAVFKIIQQQEGFTAFVPGSTQVSYSKCLYCKVCLIGFGSFSSNQPLLRHSHALGGVLIPVPLDNV